MIRVLPSAGLLGLALITAACGAKKADEKEAAPGVPTLSKPSTVGGNFTDLPPLPPPDTGKAKPEDAPPAKPAG
jgi:hypothetical protein